ncbi:TonB-dependent receptor [Fusobacterium sp.]|uniref:TonB-dependent receptor n=1 Tax=Fusobacterium sp. TaxID=68766 RepID=UPI00261BEE33|nr:TonB-dependent receptor [Fusobacterium sp.]
MKKYLVIAAIVAVGTTLLAEEKLEGTKLDETVISTERYEEVSVMEVAKNITIINSEDIEKRGYKNIYEALKMIPSLLQIDGSLSLRGQVPKLADKNLVVLLDGIPQNGADNREFDLDIIPIEQVEKIEVVPAGGAIMYGGNATAGIINIITKNMKNQKYWGNIGTEFGKYDYKKYRVNYGMNLTEKISGEINYLTKDKNGYREGEKNDLDFIEIKSKYKLNNGKIEGKYSHSKKIASDRIKGLSKEEYEKDRKQNPDMGRYGKEYQDKYVLLYNKKLTPNLEISSSFEYKNREYEYKYPAKDKVPAYKKRDKETESLYWNGQIKYLYGEQNSIILGGEYSEATVKEKVWSNGRKSKKIYKSENNNIDYYAVGGYVQNKLAWDSFIFSQGIRVEQNKFDSKSLNYNEKGIETQDKIKDSPENIDYELTGNYLFNDTTSGYLSYNRVKRNPNLTEFSSWNTKDEETKEKKAQTIDTVELGIKSLIENVYVSGAVFYIQGKNEIMYDPKYGAMGGKSFYNLNGKTRRFGLELVSEQYFEKLTIRESFTYMNNKIVDGPYEGHLIPGVSKIIGGVGVTYEIIPQLTLNLESKYIGKTFAANDFKNEFSKIKDYIVTDISMRYSLETGVTLYGGINNVFNEIYCDYVQMSTSKTTKELKYSPAEERTYVLGIEYRF